MGEEIKTKLCRGCEENLPLSAYSKRADRKCGVQSRCKQCRKPYDEANGKRRTERKRAERQRREAQNDLGKSVNPYGELEQLKRCTGCGEVKVISSFYPRKRGKYGVDSKCKDCHSAYKKEKWSSDSTYRAQCKEANARHQKSERRKAYIKSRPEMRRKFANNWRAANPDKVRGYNRKQREINPNIRISEKMKAARRNAAQGRCSKEQWLAKCEYHGWRCIYCGVSLTEKTATVEHRKPIARKGSSWPANLAPACSTHNISKRDKTEREFICYLQLARLPFPRIPLPV